MYFMIEALNETSCLQMLRVFAQLQSLDLQAETKESMAFVEAVPEWNL